MRSSLGRGIRFSENRRIRCRPAVQFEVADVEMSRYPNRGYRLVDWLIRSTVNCHFDDSKAPEANRLRLVRDIASPGKRCQATWHLAGEKAPDSCISATASDLDRIESAVSPIVPFEETEIGLPVAFQAPSYYSGHNN